MAEEYENKQFADNIIRQRSRDGYLSATDMCKANGKLFGNYYQLDQTKEFLGELYIPYRTLLKLEKVETNINKELGSTRWPPFIWLSGSPRSFRWRCPSGCFDLYQATPR